MSITNSVIKQAARQVFAARRGYEVPFYNRDISKQEVADLVLNLDPLRGSVFIISAPMGTGKTFFIDQVRGQLGLSGEGRTPLVGELIREDLDETKETVLFVDEGDIKTSWDKLNIGLQTLGTFLRETKKIGLLLGDYSLRNPALHGHFDSPRFMTNFEPLDRRFLQGVLQQRLGLYLGVTSPIDIVDDALLDVLVPDAFGSINSFRAVLSFFEQLVHTLPNNDQPCFLTLQLAVGYVQETFAPEIHSDQQEAFLNLFLDYIAQNHPRAAGLDRGITGQQLFSLGNRAGYSDWVAFQEEILEPFGRQGLLLSKGVPGLDRTGRFVRWPEPYFPASTLVLMAET